MPEGGDGAPPRAVTEPARRPAGDLWTRALSPLPWAVGLLVLTWAVLYLLRRYLR